LEGGGAQRHSGRLFHETKKRERHKGKVRGTKNFPEKPRKEDLSGKQRRSKSLKRETGYDTIVDRAWHYWGEGMVKEGKLRKTERYENHLKRIGRSGAAGGGSCILVTVL